MQGQGGSYHGPIYLYGKSKTLKTIPIMKSKFDEFIGHPNDSKPLEIKNEKQSNESLNNPIHEEIPTQPLNQFNNLEPKVNILEPKVNIPFISKPGQLPRRIALERLKRQFVDQNMQELLKKANFNRYNIDLPSKPYNQLQKQYPLLEFDNAEYETRALYEWLELTKWEYEKKTEILKSGDNVIILDTVLFANVINESTLESKPGFVIAYDISDDRFIFSAINENSLDSIKIDSLSKSAHFKSENIEGYEKFPRIQVAFNSEDFEKVIERLDYAFKSRYEFIQSQIKEMDISKLEEYPIPEINDTLKQKFGNSKVFMNELHVVAMNASKLHKQINMNWKDLKLVLDFQERQREFTFLTFFTKLEAHDTLLQVSSSCNKLFGGSFNSCVVNFSKPVRLDEFEQVQNQALSQAKNHLKEIWFKNMINTIKNCLKNAGKGWYSTQIDDIEIYNSSKLYKLMKRICFVMEDTVRSLTIQTLEKIESLFSSLVSDIPDIIGAQVGPGKLRLRPLFFTDLKYDHHSLNYSLDEVKFKRVILSVFDSFLSLGEGIPVIERHVLTRMFWSAYPTIQIPSINDPLVIKIRKSLELNIDKSFTALHVYASQYKIYKKRLDLDVDQYIKDYNSEFHTIDETETTIIQHNKDWEILDKQVPSSVKLGVFYINCDSIKTFLRKDFAKSHLDSLSKKAYQTTQSVVQQFNTVFIKLKEKSSSIEDTTLMKEFMIKSQNVIETEKLNLSQISKCYNVFETFHHEISNEEFKLRCIATQFPSRISDQLEITRKMIDDDESMFLKSLQNDQEVFKDRMATLLDSVTSFSRHFDISKIGMIMNDVSKINNELKECVLASQVINSREKLFGIAVTNFQMIGQYAKDFEPCKLFWQTANDWLMFKENWMNGVFLDLDSEEVEKNLMNCWRVIFKGAKAFKQNLELLDTSETLKNEIESFKVYLPLIQALCNKGIRERHWEQLSDELGYRLHPDNTFTLKRGIGMGLMSKIGIISKVCDGAGKEYAIESALDKMEGEWREIELAVVPYKETGTYITRFNEELLRLLDDQIVMTQSMTFSPFKKVFSERIHSWESKLRIVQETIDAWMSCQRSWLYLEPIFSSDDIKQQLPAESKRFLNVDRMWRRTMSSAKSSLDVIEFCSDSSLLDNFRECNKLLEIVSKGLSAYLESKCIAFPRFFFLSDDELLQILSQTKDPTAVQPHLKKCFENVAALVMDPDYLIKAMVSSEDEHIEIVEPFYPKGPVETWLRVLENQMKASLRKSISDAISTYPTKPRREWVKDYPGQTVIAVSQIFWTQQVSNAIQNGKEGVKKLHGELIIQLNELVELVRGDLDPIRRMILGDLIVIDVHARDVVFKLQTLGVDSMNDFEWISQLRYYWENDDLRVKIVNANFKYGYEYLGNTGRLVITPLTDRCYLTLTGAMHLGMGGAPAGPAGTGKTETTKDLAKSLAKQCVVFNCSDQLDYLAMAKFFKGLAASGAWACFDEFNRIDIEVLSVVAQQIMVIQKAAAAGVTKFVFEGIELPFDSANAIFITMNPGYAGRTELPDNLKALFRPVSYYFHVNQMAMMIPNYAMIAEISLYSFGFSDAKVLGEKMVATFKLSSEQLSSQDHYDFGMRAVKTVISSAGNLKRNSPDAPEDLIVLRALRDCNIPKFVADDIPLFNGIISDLFPGVENPPINYGDLSSAINTCIEEQKLVSQPIFVDKCIQLYETTIVRHGLMLVGPTGGGKSSCIKTLSKALSFLQGRKAINGTTYQKVQINVLNPKSISMGQLYGEFDQQTHEWSDGILPTLMRIGVEDTTPDKKWYIFDGPVDAVWIETMNTLLDDNKKLCLTSGEIIKMKNTQTMMFEVDHLSFASPATVSRCGMIYMEPSVLGITPIYESWCKKAISILPQEIKEQFKTAIDPLFEHYIDPSIEFIKKNVKEVVASTSSGLVNSFMKLLMSVIIKFFPDIEKKDGEEESQLNFLESVEPLFVFSVLWTLGVTADMDGRRKFEAHIRDLINLRFKTTLFPGEFLYDYFFDSRLSWVKWGDCQDALDAIKCNSNIVPTIDTIRNTYILELLVKQGHHVMCIGPTGTGKSVTIQNKLMNAMPENYSLILMNFSARSSAIQTQDFLESRFEKRRKGVMGPPLGKKCVVFVDDLNMPMLDICNSQPPIELLRQWMDYGGWYDSKNIGKFMEIVELTFITAMGPPGGGRNPVTSRFTRHFNYLSFTEMEDASMQQIFSKILGTFLERFSEKVMVMCDKIIQASIMVYNTIRKELLPTPNKSHYTFNLRDLSKVVQGLLSADVNTVYDEEGMTRIWVHECMRVFHDRLVDNTDKNWFMKTIEGYTGRVLKLQWDLVYRSTTLLYVHFSNSGSEAKYYTEVQDLRKVVKSIEDYLEEYNASCTSPMKLVLFIDAVSHLARICRILRQPSGHALLLGVGGSGKQSLSKLACYISEYSLHQIEISKNYGIPEWKEDLKKCTLKSGLEAQHTCLVICDTQIISEACLEDINNILNSGDVPNLYNIEENERILSTMKPVAFELNLPTYKESLYSIFISRVKTYFHLILCMSPIGELFRSRLRMFPSLVNCCTIDWFSSWPEEALRSVSASAVSEMSDLGGERIVDGVVDLCVRMHESVRQNCITYKSEINRTNFVTPKSYLEMLMLYKTLLDKKRSELIASKKRTASGLEKLLNATKDVKILQEELEAMQPVLLRTSQETELTMKKIATDKIKAEEIKLVVQKEERAAAILAEETKTIAEDAKRDLDEALPALDAALESLNSLTKNDVIEVRSMQRPPEGVKLVIEAVCIMKNIRPKKVDGDKPGKKVDDYWEPGKAMLGEPQKFLVSLLNFDKENMSEATILKIKPYIDSPEFQVAVISRVSKAATSMCQWVRAMEMYYWVSRSVAPKREKLAAAQATLDETVKVLNELKQKMKESEQNIAEMELKYSESVAKKEELSRKVEESNIKLNRAGKLISGLSSERVRWAESVELLDKKVKNSVGDMLLAAGAIAYLGAFTSEYRAKLLLEWKGYITDNEVPHSENPSLWEILGDQVKLMSWEVCGLPKDSLSKDNALIVEYTQRCPLLIDPQGQGNKWIKNMEAARGLEIVKFSDKDFLRTLENGIRFGKPVLIENIGEKLDPALEPVLLKQVFKQGGNMVIKVGESILPYHEDFRLYLTTNLPNPSYSPEISATVTLVNFTLAPSGLEDQLLALVVAAERPDLEESKNQLVLNNARMKSELKEIEDKILYLLSSVQGNPVDDERLVETLHASKETSAEIKEKVTYAEEMEKSIDATRNKYIPVAVRTRILFFCITELSMIDPMYQYSLGWFVNLFSNAIRQSERSSIVETRVENINEFFTFSLFTNVCRSLFEKHKLLFSFLLTTRIQMDDGKINSAEWKFLLAGSSISSNIPNPAPLWFPTPSWVQILGLAQLPEYNEIDREFTDYLETFKIIYESNQPHEEAYPEELEEKYNAFSKLIILRCLRPDKVIAAIQMFVSSNLGAKFIEPQSSEISLLYKESSSLIPIIFVLSAGADPASSLYKFAEEARFSKRLVSVSLGQGQGPKAEALIREGVEKGLWVLLQNCHLAPSWMFVLDKLIQSLTPDRIHREFRLWLTSMPTPTFPVSILQNGVKTTIEPPQGIKANIMRLYNSFDEQTFENTCTRNPNHFKKLLLALSFFHAVIQERRKFGALGWNIPYEFNEEGDYRICVRQLGMFLEEYSDIPYKVLNYTVGEINYGGRVTDDWDRRLITTILSDFYLPEVLDDNHSFGGPYTSIPAGSLTNYREYIKTLPIQETTDIFGMHENANMTYAQKETFVLLGTLLNLMPKNSGSASSSRETELLNQVKTIKTTVPGPFDAEAVSKKYPIEYKESMSTVLIQEIIRYNRLLTLIHQELNEVIKALKGEVVMSKSLEETSSAIYLNQVPASWASKAYPSLKPLASWTQDLIQRTDFIKVWIEKGIPIVFWISGFFFPQAFLTGTLQNYARRHVVSIDLLSFDFKIIDTAWTDITTKPGDGCYIRGLYLEGARFEGTIRDSKPKELYTEMCVIWLLPKKSRKKPESGIYDCPVYKTLTRAGTLSTTGHSTNYVLSIELPSGQPSSYWTKRGVALISSLAY